MKPRRPPREQKDPAAEVPVFLYSEPTSESNNFYRIKSADKMAQHWQDKEVRELLLIRGEEEVQRQVTGTVRDTVIYNNIANLLRERGFDRTPRQIINKLKSLRKKYLQIKDKNNRSGMGRVDWPFYELCESIYGSSALANPVRLSSSMQPSPVAPSSSAASPGPAETEEDGDLASQPPTTPTPTLEADTGSSRQAGLEEDGPPTNGQETRGFQVPPRKRKRTTMDQTAAVLGTAMDRLQAMDDAAAARDDMRVHMFMENERRMLDILADQNRELRADRADHRALLEVLISKLPTPAPLHTPSPQAQHSMQFGLHHGYDASFGPSGPAYSSTPSKHGEPSYKSL